MPARQRCKKNAIRAFALSYLLNHFDSLKNIEPASPSEMKQITESGELVGYVLPFVRGGYIVTPACHELPPVTAYSIGFEAEGFDEMEYARLASKHFGTQHHEYYVTPRAKHPNSPNRYMFSSLPLQMAFFPFDQVETISPRPILMIVGEKADTKFWSDEVLAKAQEPKELFIVKGATHMDMYDKPQFVTPAVAKLAEFFGKYLA